MIEPGEYEVRVLRAFGNYHVGDRITVPAMRGAWLLKHNFAEAVKKRRRRAQEAPQFELATDGTSEDGRTEAPPTGEEIEP